MSDDPVKKDHSNKRPIRHPFLQEGETGVFGSYCSFFAFMLVATLLVLRTIFENLTALILMHGGSSSSEMMLAEIIVLFLLFSIFFYCGADISGGKRDFISVFSAEQEDCLCVDLCAGGV